MFIWKRIEFFYILYHKVINLLSRKFKNLEQISVKKCLLWLFNESPVECAAQLRGAKSGTIKMVWRYLRKNRRGNRNF